MLLTLLLAEITTIGATTVLVIGEVIAAAISGYCLIKVAQLKSHINSRMDDLLKLTSESEFAKGKIQGKREQKVEQKVEDEKTLAMNGAKSSRKKSS